MNALAQARIDERSICFVQQNSTIVQSAQRVKPLDPSRVDAFLGHRTGKGNNTVITVYRTFAFADPLGGDPYPHYEQQLVSLEMSRAAFQKLKEKPEAIQFKRIAISTAGQGRYGLALKFRVHQDANRPNSFALKAQTFTGELAFMLQTGPAAEVVPDEFPIQCKLRRITTAQMTICMGRQPSRGWRSCIS